jgi:CheY-like chemotaxis protein
MAEHDVAPTGRGKPASKRRRLLIVEDEVMVAWALIETVHELGWKVCGTATTQDAAVEEAARLKPDAILMDSRLADGGDGLLAAQRIREATDVPIIFCTAYGSGLRSKLLSVRGVQIIPKPVRPSYLQEALAKAVDAQDERKAAEGDSQHTRW